MVQLPYLQPFDDVNKRVSRLAANIPFIKHNLSPLSFVDVDDDVYIRGMLAVYELNRIDLIKRVFLWAYERSAARYAEARQVIGEPDAFRLRYRGELRTVIADIIPGPVGRDAATAFLSVFALAHVAVADRDKFIETAESELMALNEGNFARYQVTPEVFKRWRDAW